MAPLNRSFSLPVSLSNPVSRLKALSGAADKDEVSPKSRRDSTSSTKGPLLATVEEGKVHCSSTYQRPSPAVGTSEASSPEILARVTSIDSPRKRWSLANPFRKPSLVHETTGHGEGSVPFDVLRGHVSAGMQDRGWEDGGRRRPRKSSRTVRIEVEHDKPHERILTHSSPPSPRPLTLDEQSQNLLLGAIDRGRPGSVTPSSSQTDLSGTANSKRSSGGALAALGLRAAAIGGGGISLSPEKSTDGPAIVAPKATHLQPSKPVGASSSPRTPRAPSPFFRARRSREKARARAASPEVGALRKDDYGESEVEPETEAESVGGGSRKYRPQASAYESDSDSDADKTDDDDHSVTSVDDESFLDEDGEVIFDEETEKNTEANAVFFEGDAAGLGGKSAEDVEGDDQTLVVREEQEDDDRNLDYYGEEVEQDPLGEGPNVVVPPQPLFQTAASHQPTRKTLKSGLDLRQTTALLLAKQVTGLLQRTRLNITVTCQFLHAKNARHMLLDLIDFLEPTMVIVGSRGLGKLQGILLGSTSHYLVQKSSVPVMVARRRLQRPMRKTNPANLRHSPRVGLASASIEKTASSKQEDEVMDVAESEKAEAQKGQAPGQGQAAGAETAA
ncbi:hypothetical protein IAU60_003598 [Kwoniella sp. DSM 27419]